MTTYTIEARSFKIPYLPASHNFWVLRHGKAGNAIAELHGLATNRITQRYEPIGTDESLYSLRAWHFIHDSAYAGQLGVSISPDTFIQSGQSSSIVFADSSAEALARWNTAVNAIPLLNNLDLDYPSYGFHLMGKTINSNSTYRTFGEIMGVPIHNFPGVVVPGFSNRMISPEQTSIIAYTPGSDSHPITAITLAQPV